MGNPVAYLALICNPVLFEQRHTLSPNLASGCSENDLSCRRHMKERKR
jgi:hypothetical protein